MIEIFLAIILGIIFGTISGITPGLHVNTIGIIIFSFSDKLLNNNSPLSLCTFFITIAICHAMIEFLPSLLIGVPTEDTILSIQPSHRLLFEGRGYETIRLTSVGGYGSIILLIILMPVLMIFLPAMYNFLKEYIAFLLIITMVLILYFYNKNNTQRLISALIFLVSGILGIFVLNSNLGSNLGLLTLLSGLFSISNLIISVNEEPKIPPQKDDKTILIDKGFKKSVLAGSLSGCILGLLPGFGPAQGTIIAQALTLNKNIKPEDFIVTNSGINVSDTLFSLIAIYLINNPRSAISMYINYIIPKITLNHVIFFIFVSLVSVSIACVLSIKLGDYLLTHITKLNYKKLNISIILLITMIIIVYTILTGGCLWYVILCYITSIALGILPNILNLNKSNLMGILIIPAIVTYLGF